MAKDDVSVLKAQTRLLSLYSEFRDNGGYRALADHLGINNMLYVWEFINLGKLPGNPDIQERLLHPNRKKEVEPMDQNMHTLYQLLKQNHVGIEKAIKSPELAEKIFGPDARFDTGAALREMIAELNHDHGGLICSSVAVGYFWAASLTEGLDATGRLEHRISVQSDNVKHLKDNLRKTFGGQLTMEIPRE